MAEVVKPMASEHKRIVDRLEALERLVEDDMEQRRAHFDQHNRLEERQKALEESVALRNNVEERMGWHVDRMNRLETRLQTAERGLRIYGIRSDNVESRLASKPDDFGGVTSTGAPKPMKRWVLTSNNGRRALHSWGGVMWRRVEHPPTLFATKEGAALVRDLLFQPGDDVCLEEVEVVDRDGRLVEARYVS